MPKPQFINNPLATATFAMRKILDDTGFAEKKLILHKPSLFEDGLVRYWYTPIETIDEQNSAITNGIGGSSLHSLSHALYRIREIVTAAWGPSIYFYDEYRNEQVSFRDFVRNLSTSAQDSSSTIVPAELEGITPIAEDTILVQTSNSIIPYPVIIGAPVQVNSYWQCPVSYIKQQQFSYVQETNALYSLASAFREADLYITTTFGSCAFKLPDSCRLHSLDDIRKLYFRSASDC